MNCEVLLRHGKEKEEREKKKRRKKKAWLGLGRSLHVVSESVLVVVEQIISHRGPWRYPMGCFGTEWDFDGISSEAIIGTF